MDIDFEQNVKEKFKLDSECEERYNTLSGYYLDTLKEEIIAKRKVNKLLKLLRTTEIIQEIEFQKELIQEKIIKHKFDEYNILQKLFIKDCNSNGKQDDNFNRENEQLKKVIRLLINQNQICKQKYDQLGEYITKMNDLIQRLNFTNSTQDQIIDIQMIANQAMVQSQQNSIQIQNDEIQKMIDQFKNGEVNDINLQYIDSFEDQINKNFLLLQNKKLVSQNFFLQEQINDLRCQMFQKNLDIQMRNAEIETAISTEFNTKQQTQSKSQESENQNTNSFQNYNQNSQKHDSNVNINSNRQYSQRSHQNQDYTSSHQSGSYRDQNYDAKNFHSFNPQDQQKQKPHQFSQRQNQIQELNDQHKINSQKFDDSKVQKYSDKPYIYNNDQDQYLVQDNLNYIQQQYTKNQDDSSPGNSLLLYRKSLADTQRKNNSQDNNIYSLYQNNNQDNQKDTEKQNQLMKFNHILLKEQNNLLENLQKYQDKQIIYMENLEELSNLLKADSTFLQTNTEDYKNYIMQQRYLLEYKQQYLNELNEKAYIVQENLNLIQKTNNDMKMFFLNEKFQDYDKFLDKSQVQQFKKESKLYVNNNNKIKLQLKITEENDLQIQNDESFIQNKLNEQKQKNHKQRIQEQYQFLKDYLLKDNQLNQRRSLLRQQQLQLPQIKNQQNINFRRNSSIIKQLNQMQKTTSSDITLQDFDNYNDEDSKVDTQEKLEKMIDSRTHQKSEGRTSKDIGSSQFYTFQQLKGESNAQQQQSQKQNLQNNQQKNQFDQVNDSYNQQNQVQNQGYDQQEEYDYSEQDQVNDSNFSQQDQVNDSNYDNDNKQVNNSLVNNKGYTNDSFFQNNQQDSQKQKDQPTNLSFYNEEKQIKDDKQNLDDSRNYIVTNQESNFFDIPDQKDNNINNQNNNDKYTINLNKNSQDINQDEDQQSQQSGNTRKHLQKYISRHNTQYTNITQNSDNKNKNYNDNLKSDYHQTQSFDTQNQTHLDSRQGHDFQNSKDTDEYSNNLNSDQLEPKSIFSNTKEVSHLKSKDQFQGTLSPTTTQMDNKPQFPQQNLSQDQRINPNTQQQNMKYFSDQKQQQINQNQQEPNYFDNEQEDNNRQQDVIDSYQSNTQQQTQDQYPRTVFYTQQNMSIYQKQKEDEELIKINEEFYALQSSIKRIENFLNQQPFNITTINNVPKSMVNLINDIEELKYDISIANKEFQQTKIKFDQMQRNPISQFKKFSELGIYKDVQSLKNIVGLLETKAEYIEKQSRRNI